MECECTVSGKILIQNLGECKNTQLDFSGFKVRLQIMQIPGGSYIQVSLPNVEERERISENEICELCKELSRRFASEVYMYRDLEEYGNANVFNGGSDYEVINETCFLCAYKNGEQVLCEKTNCWNDKFPG